MDRGHAITVDASGNVYTTGFFEGTADFDPSSSTYNLTAIGQIDVFIQKLDASGSFLWAKSIGGSLQENGNAIEIDAFGNIYIVGEFQGTADFDPGPGTFILSSMGHKDVFILKLDSLGNFIWAKSTGGTLDDYGYSMVIDRLGNIYTTGIFHNTVDFDPGPGIYNITSTGGLDIFIQKLDSSGSFVWAKSVEFTLNGISYSISVDDFGNVYTTGTFSGTADFNPNSGIYYLSSNAGSTDIFILKLDSSGSFVWAKSMGGIHIDSGRSIKVDNQGNVYTTGSFQQTVDFDPSLGGSHYISALSTEDIYIHKLDSSGNFMWVKTMGEISINEGRSISLDTYGNIYTTGIFEGTADFDPGAGTYNLTSAGNHDVFIQKLDSSGSFIWALSIGGIASDYGNSIYIDHFDNIYTTGFYTATVDFNPGAGVYNLVSAGSQDIYISKLGSASVGLFENKFESNIKLYPNPVLNGNVSVTLDLFIERAESLSIFDVSGKIYYHHVVGNYKSITLDVSNLTAGFYLLQVNTDKGHYVEKLLVK